MKKRNKIKNYLKTGVLLLGVFVLLINCKEDFQEVFDENQQENEYIIETLSHKQLENNEPVFSKLKNKFNIQEPIYNSKEQKYFSKFKSNPKTFSSKNFSDLDPSIDMSVIKKITAPNYVSYTMRINEPQNTTNSFYNIVVQEKNEVQEIFTLKYTPSENQSITSNSFEGTYAISRGMCLPDQTGDCNGNFDDSEGGGSGSPPDGFIEVCEEVIVMVEVLCTGANHHVGDTCECGITVNCSPAYYTPSYEEICHWDYVGSGSSGNPDTGNNNPSPGSSNSSGSNNTPNIVTSPIEEITLDDALESLVECILNITPEQEAWLINAQENNDNNNNFTDIWNYIVANGCSPITQEVISESINEDLINPDAFEEAFKLKKECAKIKRIFDDAPTYKQQLIDLNNGVTSDTQEKGIAIFKNDSSNPQVVTSISGGVIEFDLNPSSPYISMTHTHDAFGEGNGTFSVNSFADLILTSSIAKKYKIKANRFVSFLITAKGTRYAFTINNASKFRNAFYNIIMDNIDGKVDMDRVKEMEDIVEDYYEGDEAIIKTSNTDNSTVKKAFLQMLKEMDAGVSLFEISADFETFTHLILEDDNTTITPQICN